MPNSAHALNFKIKTEKGDKQTQFSICRDLIDVWGKPAESKLKEVMVAYVKRHGWAKDVSLDLKNSPKSINTFIKSLPKSK